MGVWLTCLILILQIKNNYLKKPTAIKHPKVLFFLICYTNIQCTLKLAIQNRNCTELKMYLHNTFSNQLLQ